MILRLEIIQQLLFVKTLLSKARVLPEANPSSFSIAKKILTAHDAAELGIAAIANQLEALPEQNLRFLMNYFAPIKRKKHPNEDVKGKEYFRQLNEVRNGLKHGMILPNSIQWVNVEQKVYQYVSIWCQTYLEISLDDLETSLLINNKKIRDFFGEAKVKVGEQNYREVLELLAKATYLLFEENNAHRSLQVGVVRAEDAIKLAAYGVHTNDFLALQEFLPCISGTKEEMVINWKQDSFGHPGNWREDSAKFCLDAFLDMTLKIQDAEWIPGPLDFNYIYEHKIEAIKDGVEIRRGFHHPWGDIDVSSPPQDNVLKVLRKGESLRGTVSLEPPTGLSALLPQGMVSDQKRISITTTEENIYKGSILLSGVKITCVPKDDDFVKKYFPNLPTIDWSESS